jgi:glycopeptide antibiotics resistance protein
MEYADHPDGRKDMRLLRDDTLRRRWGHTLLWCSLAAALLATLYPFRFHFDARMFARIDWTFLYRRPDGSIRIDRDLLQNLVLMAPMGAGLALLRAPLPIWRIGLEAAVLGFGTSTFVEFMQIFEYTRYPQLADVWRNGTGCVFAALAVAIVVRLVRSSDTMGSAVRGNDMYATHDPRAGTDSVR